MRKLILTHLFVTASVALAFFSMGDSAFAEVVDGSDNSSKDSHTTL